MFLYVLGAFLPSLPGWSWCRDARPQRKSKPRKLNNYVSFIDRETGDNRRIYTKLHRALTTEHCVTQAKTTHAFPFTQYSTHAMHRFSEERDERREAREA